MLIVKLCWHFLSTVDIVQDNPFDWAFYYLKVLGSAVQFERIYCVFSSSLVKTWSTLLFPFSSPEEMLISLNRFLHIYDVYLSIFLIPSKNLNSHKTGFIQGFNNIKYAYPSISFLHYAYFSSF